MLFLEIVYDEWVTFEAPDKGEITIPKSEYEPEAYGHSPDGHYTHPGSGGVYMDDTIHVEKGWCWIWNDPAEVDEKYWSGVHPDRQDCYDEAFTNLYLQWEPEDRLGTVADWYNYAYDNKLSDKVIDVSLTADNSHF